jgi:hypothetical protein
VIAADTNDRGEPEIGAPSADVAVMVPLPAADGVKVTLLAADELDQVSDVGENVPDRLLREKVIVSVVVATGVSVIVAGCPGRLPVAPLNVKSTYEPNAHGEPPTARPLADVNVSVTGPGAVGVYVKAMSAGDSATESDVGEKVPLPLVANVIVSVAAGVPVGTMKN